MPGAYSSPQMTAWIDKECGGNEHPLILRCRSAAHGVQFADVLTFEIEVDVPDPFPFPRPDSTQITQADFPAIIETVRAKPEVLGPGKRRPRARCALTGGRLPAIEPVVQAPKMQRSRRDGAPSAPPRDVDYRSL